jgi:hypothetical protein
MKTTSGKEAKEVLAHAGRCKMRTQINEVEMRAMIEGLKVNNPDITIEHIVRRVRLNLESEGREWSEDLERKVMYCIHINPNKDNDGKHKRSL